MVRDASDRHRMDKTPRLFARCVARLAAVALDAFVALDAQTQAQVLRLARARRPSSVPMITERELLGVAA